MHGGNLREAAEKYGIGERDLLDFSANINPLGPSVKAVQAINENLDIIINYPDPEAKQLRCTASQILAVPEDMIMAGNGAVEIIYLLMKTLNPGSALISAPTFNEYEIAVRSNGGLVKDLLLDEKKGFAVDVEKLCSEMADTDVVFLCNPNNPTGRLIYREDLIKIIVRAERLGKYVIIDEAFMDFVPDRGKYSVADMITEYENLFVLYSLTKFFAIPGLRLGLGLGSRGLVSRLNLVRDPWNVNCFAQLAGTASLLDEEYITATVNYVSQEKEFLYERLRSIPGIVPYPPAANYVFVDIRDTGFSSAEIRQVLGRQGLLVRDCSSYKNLHPVFIRVAVRKRAENERLVAALKQLGRK